MSANATARPRVIHLGPSHALVSCLCFLTSLASILTFCSLPVYCTCVYLSSSHPIITAIHPICIYINSSSISPESVSRWVLRFCCEMCGWGGKKSLSFLCSKIIARHFSVLVLSLSRWICSQQCHWESREMFFIVSKVLARPCCRHNLVRSLPSLGFLRFLSTSIWRLSPFYFGAAGEDKWLCVFKLGAAFVTRTKPTTHGLHS